MPTVSLIVTGHLEEVGLASSLGRVFPAATFSVEKRLDSFTSARAKKLGPTRAPALVDKIAERLVATVDPGRGGKPADHVMVVEDLEVANLDQPEVVVDVFRDAVERHIERVWSSLERREKGRERLRERASFHLFSPMIEAYFFADPAWLAAAGVTAATQLAAGTDLEDFVIADTTYLEAPPCPKSWAMANRARHPKHYLQFLLDPNIPPATKYRETQEGARALECVDWKVLVAKRVAHVRLARSMLLDLADGLGRPADLSPGPAHPATRGRPTLLRNA
jgi:hypothetical protein